MKILALFQSFHGDSGTGETFGRIQNDGIVALRQSFLGRFPRHRVGIPRLEIGIFRVWTADGGESGYIAEIVLLDTLGYSQFRSVWWKLTQSGWRNTGIDVSSDSE